MADISNSKVILAKITKRGNYMLQNWKYARKILKNTEKIPAGLKSAQNAKKPQNIQIICFAG